MAFTAQKAIQGNRSGGGGATELDGDAECHSERQLQHSQTCLLVWFLPEEAETFQHRGRQAELAEVSQAASQSLEPGMISVQCTISATS